MNNTERVSDYITRIQKMTNQLKRKRERILEQRVVEKILKLLIETFENVICAIDQSKDLIELSIDELISSLLAYEQRKNSQGTTVNGIFAAVVL
jgi:gag-polypeptide of LTR copia-type